GLRSTLVDEDDIELGGQRPMRVYLDGLDEVPNIQWRQRIVEIAFSGIRQFDNLSVVLTARDYVLEPWLSWLPRVHLSGLDNDEIAELAGKWLVGKDGGLQSFLKLLGSNSSLRQLMSSPLLATITILVFRKKRQLPANRAQLYNMFVDLLCGGWDLAKGVLRASRFSVDVKLAVLGELAQSIHSEGVRQFRQGHLEKAIAQTFPRLVEKTQDIQDELLVDGLIIREAHVLQFRHHSFQEYFTAKDLVHSLKPLKLQKAVISFFETGDWWDEVVRIYVELCGKPKELARFLFDDPKVSQRINTSKLQRLLVTIDRTYPEAKISDVAWFPEGAR
ncbi:MAG: hypothetical protein AAFX06_19450, partial [Planctomycetota bacterium]